jgi:integrase
MVTCLNGHMNPDNQHFCGECGGKLVPQAQPPTRRTAHVDTWGLGSKRMRKKPNAELQRRTTGRLYGRRMLLAAWQSDNEERLRVGAGYGSGDYVASDELGKPYHPNLLTFRWGKLLDGLKIERVRLHDARHSCATLMHLRGVPIAVIAAWLGHASAAFTISVYAHSQDVALKSAASSFTRVVITRDTETGPGS